MELDITLRIESYTSTGIEQSNPDYPQHDANNYAWAFVGMSIPSPSLASGYYR
jgi:hypothetical protein